MDTLGAFARGEIARSAGNKVKIFDWNKAAEIIKERKPTSAQAGLSGDWEYTGGCIYCDGKPLNKNESYTYLSSVWATPELKLIFQNIIYTCDEYNEYDNDYETIPCFIIENDNPNNWDCDTFWPQSALDILNIK